jgi:prepilin-type N-terminal cleavage/methylation domain-containing protein
MRRGFTLLELMIVVGVIAILGAVGFFVVSRRTDKTAVEKAARDLQTRIAYARSLAENVGPRNGTPLLFNDPSCIGGIPANTVAVSLDPTGFGSYTVPVDTRYDTTTDVMTVRCQTFNVQNESKGQGQMITATGSPLVVAFTNLGRIDLPGSTPPSTAAAYMARVQRIGNPQDGGGFRVLPSGVICRADTSAAAVDCHED